MVTPENAQVDAVQSVFVVDDSADVRRSTAHLLEANGFSVRMFPSAKDFIAVAETVGPGVLLIDLRMPGLSGVEALPHIERLNPAVRTVIVTGHGDIRSAVSSLKAGAVDFLQKPFLAKDLLAIVRQEFTALSRSSEEIELKREAMRVVATLSNREREVVEALVRGRSVKVIAFHLGLSPRTVEMHKARAMQRLESKNMPELIAKAVRGGLQ